MKKVLSLLVIVAMLVSIFITPSFALSYSDFLYEIIDGKAVIIGYDGDATAVTVPAVINNTKVVKVNDCAFKDNAKITSITISEGIEDIGSSAFENCTSLEIITLPETIIHIGEKAIYNTAYYNDASNWKLKRTDNNSSTSGGKAEINWEDISAPILQYLYLGKNLIEIELEGVYSVKYGTLVIADGAFKGNVGAIDVGFPTSIVSIGCNAFEGCTSLNSVRNLHYVKYIGNSAFKDCKGLEKIIISETAKFSANSIYNTGFYNDKSNWQDGVLYMDTRVAGSHIQNEIIIKDGTTEIISGAIDSSNVLIPKSVTSISEDAFKNENTTIFGYANSYAQVFANDNNIKFVDLSSLLKGDVNFDGALNYEDYSILSSISSLQTENTYLISLAGDMNEDTAIDGFDVVILDLFLNDIGPSTIKGDADGNGEVNELDYELLVKISSLQAKITDNYMFHRCDINDDGAVDNFDAIYLDLALNGLVAIV